MTPGRLRWCGPSKSHDQSVACQNRTSREPEGSVKYIQVRGATTHLDRQSELFTRGALEGMARQVSRMYIPLMIDHDPRHPPAALCMSRVAVRRCRPWGPASIRTDVAVARYPSRYHPRSVESTRYARRAPRRSAGFGNAYSGASYAGDAEPSPRVRASARLGPRTCS
jgi:hypothetical protein